MLIIFIGNIFKVTLNVLSRGASATVVIFCTKTYFPKKKCYQCTSPQEFLLFSFGPKICRPEYFCGFIITKLLAYSLTFPVLLRWLRGGCTLFVIEASSATFVFLKQVKHFISHMSMYPTYPDRTSGDILYSLSLHSCIQLQFSRS